MNNGHGKRKFFEFLSSGFSIFNCEKSNFGTLLEIRPFQPSRELDQTKPTSNSYDLIVVRQLPRTPEIFDVIVH